MATIEAPLRVKQTGGRAETHHHDQVHDSKDLAKNEAIAMTWIN